MRFSKRDKVYSNTDAVEISLAKLQFFLLSRRRKRFFSID